MNLLKKLHEHMKLLGMTGGKTFFDQPVKMIYEYMKILQKSRKRLQNKFFLRLFLF